MAHRWANFTLVLYYKSPAAYKFLRAQNVKLPSPSTIRKWMGSSKFKPGFNLRFLEHIKRKFENRCDRERAAVLCFDEIVYCGKFAMFSRSRFYWRFRRFRTSGTIRENSKVCSGIHGEGVVLHMETTIRLLFLTFWD